VAPDVNDLDYGALAATITALHDSATFMVTEEAATAIRTAFDQGGELAAAVELRRLFPDISDNAKARECARTITGWQPLSVKPVKKPTVSPRW
jgi:hypothetical protein